MNRLLKITASVVLLIVLIIIIAIVLMVLFIDPNRFKPLLIKEVKAETGRTLSIDGKLSWSFFPAISIKTGPISLSNPSGYTQKTFLSAKQAKANVKLIPLLSGNVVPKTIVLKHASIQLVENSNGHKNWQFASHNNVGASQTSSKASSHAFLHSNLYIPDVEIENANINYVNEKTHQHFALSHLDVKAKHARYNYPFALSMKGDFVSNHPGVKMHAALNATVVYNEQLIKLDNIYLQGDVALQQNGYKSKPFTLSGNFNLSNQQANFQPININFDNARANGYINIDSIQSLAYRGAVNIQPFNLKQLLTFYDINTHFANRKALNKVSMSAIFKGDDNQLVVSSFNSHVDHAHISGNLHISNFTQRIMTFALYGKHLNLDNYQTTQSVTAVAAHNKIQKPTQTSVNTLLNSMDASGKIALQDFTVQHLHFDSFNSNIVANHGYINAYPLQGNAYHGKVLGSFSANFIPRQASYHAQLDLTNLQIQPLLRDLINSKRFSGSVDAHLNLNTLGNNTQTLKKNSNGQVRINLHNGTLHNIDLDYYYKAGMQLLRGQKPTATKDHNTHIGSLSATFNIDNGIASNNDLYLQNHDFSINGSGTINLVKNTLNYLLKINDKHSNSIPLTLSGNLSAPSLRLDHSAVANTLRHHAEKHIRDELKEKVNGNSKLKQALQHLSL